MSREELPYSRAGLLVERSSAYVKINIRLMLTFMWNGEDSALVRVPTPPSGGPPRLGGGPRAGWGGRRRLELPLPCPQLELDPKYANQTCGLCGDFNGLRAVSEFYTHSECPRSRRGGWPTLAQSLGSWRCRGGSHWGAGQGSSQGCQQFQ